MTAGEPNPDRLPGHLAREVRMVLLDVDGVLTDGGVYVGGLPDGESVELKRFDIQDGLGIKMLLSAGIEVAVVSGRVSDATRIRVRELGIRECHQDPDGLKLPVAARLVDERDFGWAEVALLADDLADLPVLRRVGLPAAVSNAVPEVKEASRWVGRSRGGNGAVREFARSLLEARGEWTRLVEEYCDARSRI